ncbi:zinc metalloprotease [Nocardia sp. NPDC051570]|uniref:zinc metalloprotease n=1 Tax=Nocardia sp. NPDC051570 TaxID=3364324 RepID=UPI00378AA9EF
MTASSVGTPLTPPPRAACQTQTPDDEVKVDNDTPAESKVVKEKESEQDKLKKDSDNQQGTSGELTTGADGQVQARLTDVRIPVHVHVIRSAEAGKVSADQIKQQIEQLNKDFGASPLSMFTFQLMGTDETDNSSWFTAPPTSSVYNEMKPKLRKGDKNALNLYLNDVGEGYLGFATFPADYRAKPQLDGVVVKYTTLPGGSLTGYNTGKIATHEIGHWLGLYHPFQGGCTGPGDEVDDTPAEADPATECTEGVKSCGSDSDIPVHNHMNYTPDNCRTEFTPGQAKRAENQWAAYRQPTAA